MAKVLQLSLRSTKKVIWIAIPEIASRLPMRNLCGRAVARNDRRAIRHCEEPSSTFMFRAFIKVGLGDEAISIMAFLLMLK